MKHIAFLRGINVGGVKLKMADLKADFEAHGFTEVETVLATGNVIFSAESVVPDLSFLPVPAFVRTDSQVRQIFEQNPLSVSADRHIYVFISEPDFAQTALTEFEALKTPAESAAVVADTFYWQVPKGSTLDTPFGKILGKAQYKAQLTSRNLNTIEKIARKL